MAYYTVFCKPIGLPEKDFLAEASQKMRPYSKGTMRPIRLSEEHDDIYIIPQISIPIERLGYRVLMPGITKVEILSIRKGLENGSRDILDFRKNVIYTGENFNINTNLYAPDLNDINVELIDYLSKHPQFMHELNWRKFEELIEVLLRAKGYETELGPGSGDGGVDIRMISKSGVNENILTLVQVKKHSEKNKIKLTPVQGLYGVLEAQKASSGLFVTTSTYEPCARRFAESFPHRLQLADKYDVRQWLKDYTYR